MWLLKCVLVVVFAAALVLGTPCRPKKPLSPEKAKLFELVHSNDDFDKSLLQALEAAGPTKNAFISSFSIGSVLSMIMVGSVNQTYREIYSTLGFPSADLSNTDILRSYKTLLHELHNPPIDVGNELKVANSLAIQKNKPFLESYINNVTLNFESQLFVEDFGSEGAKATNDLNSWVSAQTNGKIAKLFDEELPADTLMVLLNAIYFKGIWEYRFEAKDTVQAPFFSTPTTSKPVSFMVRQGYFHYAPFDDGELLEIPYQNKTLSMFIWLPKADSAPTLTSMLTNLKLEERIHQLLFRDVVLSLPKFKFDSSYSLKQTLQKLGISEAFTPRADFSNIDGQQDLRLSEVLHKTFIEVNEEGSEAAAATGAIMVLKCVPTPAPPPIEFRVNRPFLFFIRDNGLHLTLFSGIVNKP